MRPRNLPRAALGVCAIAAVFLSTGLCHTPLPGQVQNTEGRLVVRETSLGKPPAEFFALTLPAAHMDYGMPLIIPGEPSRGSWGGVAFAAAGLPSNAIMGAIEAMGQAGSEAAKGVEARVEIPQDTGSRLGPPSGPPTQTEREAFAAARRVRLLVKTVPGQAPAPGAADPYRESSVLLCKELLEAMGLSVVDSSAADFDATLELEVTTFLGTARGETKRLGLIDYATAAAMVVFMPGMAVQGLAAMAEEGRKKELATDGFLGRISFVFPSGELYSRPFAGEGISHRYPSLSNSVLWAPGGFGDELLLSVVELGGGTALLAHAFLSLALRTGHTATDDSQIPVSPDERLPNEQEEETASSQARRLALQREYLASHATLCLARLGWKPATLEEKVAWHLYWGDEAMRFLTGRPFSWFHIPHPERDEAKHLAQLGGQAVPLLIPHLEDQAPWTRITAAEALGEMREKSALPALQQALAKEEHPRAKEAIGKAMMAGTDVRAYVYWRARTKRAIERAISRIGR